jgi:hypothetical protein
MMTGYRMHLQIVEQFMQSYKYMSKVIVRRVHKIAVSDC